MLKPRFCVSLSTGTHLKPKKGNRIPYMWQNAAIVGTYVSARQVGVHFAHFESWS